MEHNSSPLEVHLVLRLIACDLEQIFDSLWWISLKFVKLFCVSYQLWTWPLICFQINFYFANSGKKICKQQKVLSFIYTFSQPCCRREQFSSTRFYQCRCLCGCISEQIGKLMWVKTNFFKKLVLTRSPMLCFTTCLCWWKWETVSSLVDSASLKDTRTVIFSNIFSLKILSVIDSMHWSWVRKDTIYHITIVFCFYPFFFSQASSDTAVYFSWEGTTKSELFFSFCHWQ